MSLEPVGYVELPANIKPGGFDHAAIHHGTAHLYVAHTANDALDVVDCASDHYLHSIPNLISVAGALVSHERNLVFTSNRGENTVGIFSPGQEAGLVKVGVGVRPNGLAYDPRRNHLLVAHVGDPALPGSLTISIVDVEQQAVVANLAVPGRTRWTVFDAQADVFYVNIADPALIIVIDAADPTRIMRTFAIPAAGPHGLDLDSAQQRLFCACDGQKLISLDAYSGKVFSEADLTGIPDVIFFNAALNHLYVAIGDPGVVDVFDTETMSKLDTVQTEKGAHTLAFDDLTHKVYVFLPQTHRAAIFRDGK